MSSGAAGIVREFKKEIASLDLIFEFVREFVALNRFDESVGFLLRFVLEELFTNTVKYNPDRHDVAIRLARDGERLVITVADRASVPFNIADAKGSSTTAQLPDRRPGGLGIHLVKRMVDTVDWRYADGRNEITLVKKVG